MLLIFQKLKPVLDSITCYKNLFLLNQGTFISAANTLMERSKSNMKKVNKKETNQTKLSAK